MAASNPADITSLSNPTDDDVDWPEGPYPGPRPAWQDPFFPFPPVPVQDSQAMRIASHLDIHRLATIAVCNIPRHDEQRWMAPTFDRTNPDSVANAIKSILDSSRARVMDPCFTVVAIYGPSKGSEAEWREADVQCPPPLGSRHPWLNARPIPEGDSTIVGFIIVYRAFNAVAGYLGHGPQMHAPDMPSLDEVEIPPHDPDLTVDPDRRNRWMGRVTAALSDLGTWPHSDPSCLGHNMIDKVYVHPAYYNHGYEERLIGWATGLFGSQLPTLLTVATNFDIGFFERANFRKLANVCTERIPNYNWHSSPDTVDPGLHHDENEITDFAAILMCYFAPLPPLGLPQGWGEPDARPPPATAA
ncbi:hypothetical protein QBC39DRAFT_371438 [Podospora conica]|nr:hypothetical protein QBC39DRAFT_371438 [Schizothecium conicum]